MGLKVETMVKLILPNSVKTTTFKPNLYFYHRIPLILTWKTWKPYNCPLQVESNFFQIRIIMRGTGQPKIHPKSNISNSHHDPSRLPWLSHKNTTQEDNTYIVYNILLYLSMKNEWVQQLLPYLSFYWKRNKLCYVMWCYVM